jgi:hypothetical protein
MHERQLSDAAEITNFVDCKWMLRNSAQKIISFLAMLISIALVGGLGYGLFFFVLNSWRTLVGLDKAVIAAIVAASGTVLASVGAVVYSQRRTRKSAIAEAQRPQKIEVYKNFMQFVVDIMRRSMGEPVGDSVPTLPQVELEEFFFSFTRDIILWGSPQVISAYNRFRMLPQDAPPANTVISVDHILREIRKDLGHSNRRLHDGDLMKLFLKNPNEIELILNGQAKK